MIVPWSRDPLGNVVAPDDVVEPPPYFVLTGSDLPSVLSWRGLRYEHLRNGLFIAEGATDVEVANLFEELAPSYEEGHVNIPFNHVVYQKLGTLAAAETSSTIANVLDFGCGTGVGLRPLRLSFPRARLLATDLSSTMVQLAAERGFEPVSMAVDRIGLDEETVDVVIGAFVLGLMRSSKPVAEIARILKPGGAAAFNVYKPPPDWTAKYSQWFDGAGLAVRVSREESFVGGGIEAHMPVIVAKKG